MLLWVELTQLFDVFTVVGVVRLYSVMKGLKRMETAEQRRKQSLVVGTVDSELVWSRKIPDQEGIWLRLKSKRGIAVHSVRSTVKPSGGSKLMINWGIEKQTGFMLITPISIRRKLDGWLWCGPIPFCPSGLPPICPRVSMEPLNENP